MFNSLVSAARLESQAHIHELPSKCKSAGERLGTFMSEFLRKRMYHVGCLSVYTSDEFINNRLIFGKIDK